MKSQLCVPSIFVSISASPKVRYCSRSQCTALKRQPLGCGFTGSGNIIELPVLLQPELTYLSPCEKWSTGYCWALKFDLKWLKWRKLPQIPAIWLTEMEFFTGQDSPNIVQAIWLLIGGIPTPLKNMKVSWDYCSQYVESNKIHVPNHQPDYYFSIHLVSTCPIHFAIGFFSPMTLMTLSPGSVAARKEAANDVWPSIQSCHAPRAPRGASRLPGTKHLCTYIYPLVIYRWFSH